MEKTICLSIKKLYYDAILKGEKKNEYRRISLYYSKMFAQPTIRFVKLHYYQKNYLLAEVLKISKIKKPKSLAHLSFLPDKEVFEIQLGKVEER